MPPHEQVTFIRLERVICNKFVQLRGLGCKRTNMFVHEAQRFVRLALNQLETLKGWLWYGFNCAIQSIFL